MKEKEKNVREKRSLLYIKKIIDENCTNKIIREHIKRIEDVIN